MWVFSNRILDNLPVAEVRERNDGGNAIKSYEHGFPVGFNIASQEVIPDQFMQFNLLGLFFNI